MAAEREATDTTVQSRILRRLASYALFGGGGAGLLCGVTFGVLAAEAALAKHVIGDADGPGPDANGVYGPRSSEPPLPFAVIGDSAARGYGVQTAPETPGALLAEALAGLTGRQVHLTVTAFVGAESKHLADQVDVALQASPELALVIIGVNDVVHRTPPAQAVRPLAEAIERLRAAGTEVVLGTCPDLGTIGPLAPPLRQIARVWSRRLAAAQTVAAVQAGARTVSLGPVLGKEFEAAPSELFGPDRFHPSATGYASAAAALLPSLAAVIGAWPDDESVDGLGDGELLPVSFAAARAAEETGAEVTPADDGARVRLQRR